MLFRGHVNLVGGFNLFEKYARQIENLPQIRMKIPKYLKPPPNIKMDGFGGTTILGSMLVYQRVILGDHPIPSGTITDSSPSAKVTSTEASVKSNRWMAVSSFSPSPTAWKDGNQCWVGASGESRRCE